MSLSMAQHSLVSRFVVHWSWRSVVSERLNIQRMMTWIKCCASALSWHRNRWGWSWHWSWGSERIGWFWFWFCRFRLTVWLLTFDDWLKSAGRSVDVDWRPTDAEAELNWSPVLHQASTRWLRVKRSNTIPVDNSQALAAAFSQLSRSLVDCSVVPSLLFHRWLIAACSRKIGWDWTDWRRWLLLYCYLNIPCHMTIQFNIYIVPKQ